MAKQTDTLQLNDADIAFLLNLLRHATSPMTTQDLVDALKRRSGR
jgi:predicted transcriptional regulator